MIPVILFALLVGQITFTLIWAHLSAYKLSTYSWDQLEAKLEPVGLQGIKIAANTPALQGSGLESGDLWDLMGGSEGLRRLENNARIMVALAGHMERKNNLPNMILAERMRRDGALVRNTVRSIRLTRCVRLQTSILHAQLHEAAKAYFAMKNRIPALYEMSHAISGLDTVTA